MIPESCKKDVCTIVREQVAKRALYVADFSDESKELRGLLIKEGVNVKDYDGEEIRDTWDMIILHDPEIFKSDVLEEIIGNLLPNVKKSLMLVSATYFDDNQRPTGGWEIVTFIPRVLQNLILPTRDTMTVPFRGRSISFIHSIRWERCLRMYM